MQPISIRDVARGAYATVWLAVTVPPVLIFHDSGPVASWMALLFWLNVFSPPVVPMIAILALMALFVVVARSPFVEAIAIVAAALAGAVLVLISAVVLFILAPEELQTCRGDSCDQLYFAAAAIFALAVVYLAVAATLLTVQETDSVSPLARRARRLLRGGSAATAAAMAAYLIIATHISLAVRSLAEPSAHSAIDPIIDLAAEFYPPGHILTNGAALVILVIVGGRAAGWIPLRHIGMVTMIIGLAVVGGMIGLGLMTVTTGAEPASQAWRRLGILCANGLWLAVLGLAIVVWARWQARQAGRPVGLG